MRQEFEQASGDSSRWVSGTESPTWNTEHSTKIVFTFSVEDTTPFPSRRRCPLRRSRIAATRAGRMSRDCGRGCLSTPRRDLRNPLHGGDIGPGAGSGRLRQGRRPPAGGGDEGAAVRRGAV